MLSQSQFQIAGVVVAALALLRGDRRVFSADSPATSAKGKEKVDERRPGGLGAADLEEDGLLEELKKWKLETAHVASTSCEVPAPELLTSQVSYSAASRPTALKFDLGRNLLISTRLRARIKITSAPDASGWI